jgi:RNA polymerase sigma-70 factor (ECF subfamily)
MLGSSIDGDDAAQETLVRAWQSLDRLESPSSIRSWLYRIATNVCVDAWKRRDRLPVPVGPSLATVRAAAIASGGTDGTDPAELVVSRESVRSALVPLFHLPRRQRAVFILREVLRWHAAEVAALLGVSVQAVNGALQRARASVAAQRYGATDLDRLDPPGDEQDERLEQYVDAFVRADLDALIAGLRMDALPAGRQQSGGDITAAAVERPPS